MTTARLTAATGSSISTKRPDNACLISLSRSFSSRKYCPHSCKNWIDAWNSSSGCICQFHNITNVQTSQSTTERPQTHTARPQTHTERPQTNTARRQTNTERPQTNTARLQTNTARPQTNRARPQTNRARWQTNTARPQTCTKRPQTHCRQIIDRLSSDC